MNSARFHVVGPEFHGYTRAASNSLVRLGYDSTCSEIRFGHDNTIAGAAGYYCRNLFQGATHAHKRASQDLVAIVSRLRPNYLLVIKGDWICASDLHALRAHIPGLCVVLWAQDSIANIPNVNGLQGAVDVLAVFEPTDLALATARRFPSAIHMPAAYDPACYFPIPTESMQHHVAFVGAPYSERKEFLERTGNILARDALSMCIVGNFCRGDAWSHWRLRRRFPAIERGLIARTLPPSDVNRLYANSLAVLNMHHEQSQSGFNPRTVEILASGRPQLLDRKHALSGLFPPDECVLYYESPEEAAAHAKELAYNVALRTRLARNALQYAVPHSMDARMSQLVAILQP